MKLHYDSDIRTLCFLLTRRVSAFQPAGSINHKYPNETSVRIKGTSARSSLRKMILHAQFFKRTLRIQIISRILLHAYSIESTIEEYVENKMSPYSTDKISKYFIQHTRHVTKALYDTYV